MENSGRKKQDNSARSRKEKAHPAEQVAQTRLRSHCHSKHSALPDPPQPEIKGWGRSFTLYPDSKALRWTKKPTLPSSAQPLTGTGKSLQWPNPATPGSAAALGRSSLCTGLTGACTAPRGSRRAQGKPALLKDYCLKKLQKATDITTCHRKPHTINLREREQGSHPDNQHIL